MEISVTQASSDWINLFCMECKDCMQNIWWARVPLFTWSRPGFATLYCITRKKIFTRCG